MAAPTKIRMIVAFAALYLIWGSTYLGIRFAIETIPPFLMAGSRFLIAGMIMYAIAWSQGIGKSTWTNWRTSLIIGACLILGGNGGVTVSEKYIDSGLAALIVAIVPIYIVVLGWAAGIAPRPTPTVWLGLVGGFVGVGVLLGPALRLSSNWRTTSCNWNVDPACIVFHLVGGITLFARIKTRSLSVSHRCPTDALRRIASFTR